MTGFARLINTLINQISCTGSNFTYPLCLFLWDISIKINIYDIASQCYVSDPWLDINNSHCNYLKMIFLPYGQALYPVIYLPNMSSVYLLSSLIAIRRVVFSLQPHNSMRLILLLARAQNWTV